MIDSILWFMFYIHFGNSKLDVSYGEIWHITVSFYLVFLFIAGEYEYERSVIYFHLYSHLFFNNISVSQQWCFIFQQY